MGMYTKLEYSLTLKNNDNLLELLNWLKEPYESEDSYSYKSFPEYYSHHKFFSFGRKGWFSDLTFKMKDDIICVKGCAELKNYEGQIENLFEMLKPDIINGYYKSRYEESWSWYYHTEGED